MCYFVIIYCVLSNEFTIIRVLIINIIYRHNFCVLCSCLVQVSIEFGLSEMLNTISIKPEIVPKDRKFEFLISDLESMFPEGMVDHNAVPAYKEVISLAIDLIIRRGLSISLILVSKKKVSLSWLCSDATMGRDCTRMYRSIS